MPNAIDRNDAQHIARGDIAWAAVWTGFALALLGTLAAGTWAFAFAGKGTWWAANIGTLCLFCGAGVAGSPPRPAAGGFDVFLCLAAGAARGGHAWRDARRRAVGAAQPARGAMKFLCVACDEAMKSVPASGAAHGDSLTVVFRCPRCEHRVALLTNPGETQLAHSLGGAIGGGGTGQPTP